MNNGAPEHSDKLTPREAEVLKLIVEGHTSKRIAQKLGITFKTAACHRSRLMGKLGAHNAASLVRYALAQRLFLTMEPTKDGSESTPPKTRQQLESELWELLRERRLEWTTASEETRDLARQRFLEALHLFNRVVMPNEPSEG